MKQDKAKRHKIKSPAILSRIVIMLFLLMLMFFVNINSISHFFNQSSYETVTATVIRPTTDKFFLLIPKVELTYSYRGQQYTETNFFVLEPLFGLSSEQGTELTLYVNCYAPNHSLIKVNFFHNIINWILLLLEISCIINLVRRIRTFQSEKKKRKEAQTDEKKVE